ncbi:MAG TPA: shikimate kinase, partial [Afipia sp.]
ERNPFYQLADLAIASRDVPHEKIVDETIDALFAYLQSSSAASSSSSETR